ncbi:MAG: metallophosphoesterase [Pseudohongiellaceae bacterium]
MNYTTDYLWNIRAAAKIQFRCLMLASLFVTTALFAEDEPAFPIVAVGDIHGDYDNFRTVLMEAGITNRRGNWIGGDTHFVQLGDLPDRGPDTEKIIKLMQKLQRQARRDGGQVIPLIGNHEAMNIYGDLRYVHPGEYASLRSRDARRLRSRYYETEVARLTLLDENFVADDAFESQWMNEHPLGFVEHRIAWSPDGEFGSWVVENDTIARVGRTLFLHGGVSPSLIGLSIDEINEQVRRELKGGRGEELGLSERDDGPLWYRGLASGDEIQEVDNLEAALTAFDVDRIVVGHTPGLGTIVPRFGGKVLVIDTGIAEYYGSHLASLRIEGNSYYTIQNDEKLALPDTQAEVLSYLKQVADFGNPTRALTTLIETLSQ